MYYNCTVHFSLYTRISFSADCIYGLVSFFLRPWMYVNYKYFCTSASQSLLKEEITPFRIFFNTQLIDNALFYIIHNATKFCLWMWPSDGGFIKKSIYFYVGTTNFFFHHAKSMRNDRPFCHSSFLCIWRISFFLRGS